MKAGIINWRVIQLIISLSCANFLVCTTNAPTDPAANLQSITISLVEKGITETIYDGTDIDMIIEFKDSIECSFDVIKIHSTDAQFYLPDESLTGQIIDSVVIPLYWISTAKLSMDSITEIPYDTVYVQVGLVKSNLAKVKITNLPPYIDSLIVGDTSYNTFHRIQDLNLFNYYLKDTLQNSDITFRVFARDLDSPGFNITWENSGDDKYFVWNPLSNPNVAIYKARQGNFRDLIQIVVFDTDASVEVKLKVIQLDGSETLIDSITYRDSFNDTTFSDTSFLKYIIYAITIDTASIRIYPNISGGTATWSAVNGIISTNLAADSNGCAVTYICTLSNIGDIINTDITLFIDSIAFVYNNSFGDDSVAKSIILYKKSLNKKPIIDSILIDTKMYSSNYLHIVAGGNTIPLKAYAHDPEGGSLGGTISYIWQGQLTGSLYSATGDSNNYTAANASYIDTLFLIAADSLGFTDTQMIILPSNQLPVIDSIKIDTVMYKTSYQYVVSAESTVTLKAYAHDPEGDTLGGTVAYNWQEVLNGSLSSLTGNSITYTAASGAYIDTTYLVAVDSLGFSDIQLIILPCNNPPKIDSIRVDDTLIVPVSSTDTVYNYSAIAPGTFTIKVNAHEMETAIGDAIVSYLWQYKNVNLQTVTATIDSINYISADSAYIDTVSIAVKDTYNAVNRRKVIITFTK